MLQAISKANPANRYMYVVDTRPKVCALNTLQSVSLIIFVMLKELINLSTLNILNSSFKLTKANDTKEISFLKDTNLEIQFPSNTDSNFVCFLNFIGNY